MTATLVDPFGHPGALAPEPDGATGPHRLAPEALLLVARGLVRNVGLWPELAHPRERTWARMARTEDFEAWLVAWPPGGALEWHDHGEAAGALLVAAGELVQTTLVGGAGGGVELAIEGMGPGASATFVPGQVHDVVNLGTEPALSVHVYSPALSSMTFYGVVGGELCATRTVRYGPGGGPP